MGAICQPSPKFGGGAVQGNTKERWLELCEQAITEQDPAKLYVLVREINRLLEEKRLHLNREREAQRNPPATLPSS